MMPVRDWRSKAMARRRSPSTVVVRGQGNIGTAAITGGTNNLVNNGRISADVNGGTLTIVPGAGGGAVTNNNLIDARGGGTLQLRRRHRQQCAAA